MRDKPVSLIVEDRSKLRKGLIFGGIVGGTSLFGVGINLVGASGALAFIVVLGAVSTALIIAGALITDRKITVSRQGIKGYTVEGPIDVKWQDVQEIRSFPGAKKMEIQLNDRIIPITMAGMFTPDALKLERMVRKFSEYDDFQEF